MIIPPCIQYRCECIKDILFHQNCTAYYSDVKCLLSSHFFIKETRLNDILKELF